jgi:uncharacterized protein with FMN-binding domain
MFRACHELGEGVTASLLEGMNRNGTRMARHLFPAVLMTVLIVISAACRTAPLPAEAPHRMTIADGVYEGNYSSWPNSATVRVSVKDGRIMDVVIVRHVASWIGKKAEPVIPARIIEAQSTRVDAVSGATNSSRVIMNAVQDALDKGQLSEVKP